jgi:WD40 repeat protein
MNTIIRRIQRSHIAPVLLALCLCCAPTGARADAGAIDLSAPVNGERELTAHQGEVSAISISADGNLVASGTSGRVTEKSASIQINEVQSGKLLQTLTLPDNLLIAIALSPDGSTLAAGGAHWVSNKETNSASAISGDLALWDVPTGKLRRRISDLGGRVRSLAFSPDGRSLTSVSDLPRVQGRGVGVDIRIWDVASGEPRQSHPIKVDYPRVAIAPGGQTVCVTNVRTTTGNAFDTQIGFFEANTGRLLRSTTLTGSHSVYDVEFSPDGKTLTASGGVYGESRDTMKNGAVWLWDVATATLKAKRDDFSGAVSSTAFTPDGTTLASADSRSLTIKLWDVASGQLQRELPGHEGGTSALTYAQGGESLISSGGDGMVKVWPLKALPAKVALPHVLVLDKFVRAAAYFPDGKRVAIGAEDTLNLWDTNTGQVDKLRMPERQINAVAVSPDGQTVAAGATVWQGEPGDEENAGGEVILWDMATRRQRHALISAHVVSGIAFSPDGKILTSCHAWDNEIGNNAEIEVWDVETGKLQGMVPVMKNYATATVVYSPDNRYIACGGWRGVYLIDRQTGKRANEFALGGPFDAFKAVSFSPDGKTLICGGSNAIQRWNVATGELELSVGQEFDPASSMMTSVAIAPNGLIFARAISEATINKPPSNGQSRLFDTTNGRLMATITNRCDTIHTLAFSPDSKTILTQYGQTAVRLWPLEALPLNHPQ